MAKANTTKTNDATELDEAPAPAEEVIANEAPMQEGTEFSLGDLLAASRKIDARLRGDEE